jgi:hypothetical protein
MYVAATVEIGYELNPERIGCRDQIFKDANGHRFVGDGAVAKTIDIKLQGLQLKHPWSWLIEQAQNGEIWIPRKRTKTGELR